jgi:hypothetical protein
VMIVSGLVNIFKRDWLWKSQESANSLQGLTSERTAAWDDWRSIIGALSVIIGAGILLASVLGNRPSGSDSEYVCVQVGNPIGTVPDKILQIRSDNTGTFEGKPLTWAYNSETSQFILTGNDIGLISASSVDASSRSNDLSVQLANNQRALCIKR